MSINPQENHKVSLMLALEVKSRHKLIYHSYGLLAETNIFIFHFLIKGKSCKIEKKLVILSDLFQLGPDRGNVMIVLKIKKVFYFHIF